MGRKKALLFEKRSKNFCSLGARVEETPTPYEQEFFGSFLQKRTACFLAPEVGRNRAGEKNRRAGEGFGGRGTPLLTGPPQETNPP
jgi:hypothetical protein